jgi:poly-beta-1,6-N-acetyl-D-glucosamine synthase
MTITTESYDQEENAHPRPPNPGHRPEYCLMTAAYNEEENIARTIESVLLQTWLPRRWVIVSDGSVDRTDQIIQSYLSKYDFIRFLRIKREPGRSFNRKVQALRAGSALLEGLPFDFIGNLDADISIAPSYFEDLVNCFGRDARLGLAGGFVCEQIQGQFQSRPSNRTYSVAHAAQLVRRKCYDQIGGYSGCRYGGEDWHAQTAARMAGWEATAFPELKIFHHRRTGEADNLLRDRFRLGRLDYCFGSDPFFELLKCLQRLPERPFLVGGAVRLMGFGWSLICREESDFSPQFIDYLRREQRHKLGALFSRSDRRMPKIGAVEPRHSPD